MLKWVVISGDVLRMRRGGSHANLPAGRSDRQVGSFPELGNWAQAPARYEKWIKTDGRAEGLAARAFMMF
jgi:hypothetical protein